MDSTLARTVKCGLRPGLTVDVGQWYPYRLLIHGAYQEDISWGNKGVSLTNRRSHVHTTHPSLISRNHYFSYFIALTSSIFKNTVRSEKWNGPRKSGAGRNLWSMWWSQRCIEVQVMRGSRLARRPLGSLECSGHGSARYGTAAPLPAPHLSLTWASVSPPPLPKPRHYEDNNPHL